ncbi:MAG: ABC transporter ATP-binding protein [Sulfurovum sp.]|nr:ABC transporter ATP-binding protein [Sulfurovum sp.]MCB4745041.1 ABC transporter ATP-binding protein [Sulfurovum sp.]MCB4746668.1 ABC transporter ATP-binding protein [Sulfurovum sp.]MCB4748047.1 ABC transporter ATP-binding protein [Sulfurovum sp.]MCB4748828.1 ABC transporter ATP-binding protein [Sulfurovum sp.]
MLVDIKHVSKKFMDTKVLNDVTFHIDSGDRIAMMGPNGAGKTTLVRAILGFYHIDSGEIKVRGCDPVKNRVDVLNHISFIPQLPPPVKLSINELLMYIEKSTGISKKKIYKESDRLDLDLTKQLNKPFFKLSGGMKQKLLIAIALSKKSDLLIFDEPTANLDPKGRNIFYELLAEIDIHCSTLFITHRLDEIERLVNRKIYIDLGKVVEDEKI